MNAVIGILVAVKEELAPIVKKMPSVEKESTGGLLFHRGTISGKPVVVVRSGMGAERAKTAAQQMIERYKPDHVSMCGFGGAISHAVVVGDIVIASRLYIIGSGEPPSQPAEILVKHASHVRSDHFKVVAGGLVTSSTIVRTPAEKKSLADTLPETVAVDMETSGVATAASAAGVPWLGVRAISDGADDELPFDFSGMVNPATGEVAVSRIVVLAATKPWKVPSLIQLGGRAALAARNLASFVESYVHSYEAER